MLDPDAEKTPCESEICHRSNPRWLKPSAPAVAWISPDRTIQKSGTRPTPGICRGSFLDATVENCRHVIDAVKPTRTKFTIEMMGWNLPDGPDTYLELIRAVDRPAFGVHMDVCNGINSPTRYYRNSEFITECFRKLGPWIASCHAKTWSGSRIERTLPGGSCPEEVKWITPPICGKLSKLERDAPLMLEHLKTAEEYEKGRSTSRKVAAGHRSSHSHDASQLFSLPQPRALAAAPARLPIKKAVLLSMLPKSMSVPTASSWPSIALRGRSNARPPKIRVRRRRSKKPPEGSGCASTSVMKPGDWKYLSSANRKWWPLQSRGWRPALRKRALLGRRHGASGTRVVDAKTS